MVGRLRIELRLEESESSVLPLDDLPAVRDRDFRQSWAQGQGGFKLRRTAFFGGGLAVEHPFDVLFVDGFEEKAGLARRRA